LPIDTTSPICDAIRALVLVEFDYAGRHRIVQPYLHGSTRPGKESLRAVQVGGESRSGGFGFGKIWEIALIENLQVTAASFVPDDPSYAPNDSAFATIHCRVARLAPGRR